MTDERRYRRERIRKARGAWKQVKRLTRLPAKAKKAIICGQLYPTLYYGCEGFPRATEEMLRLSREWSGWVLGAWRGSATSKVEELSGVEDLQGTMRKRRIRWAVSVYARHLPCTAPASGTAGPQSDLRDGECRMGMGATDDPIEGEARDRGSRMAGRSS